LFSVSLATAPDHEAFKYDEIRNGAIYGTHLESDPHQIFSVCRTHGLEARKESKDIEDTGDKIHISVDQNKVGEAWNLVLPILNEHRELIPEFKVSIMQKLLPEINACENDVAKAEEALKQAERNLAQAKEEKSSEDRLKNTQFFPYNPAPAAPSSGATIHTRVD
jgi:hypothetical protein